jgi:hypothetical protein
MTKTDGNDWVFRLGEIEVIDDDTGDVYTLEVGYVVTQTTLYVRLWKGAEFEFMGGDFIYDLQDCLAVSPKMLKVCVDRAKRIEKLKAFA